MSAKIAVKSKKRKKKISFFEGIIQKVIPSIKRYLININNCLGDYIIVSRCYRSSDNYAKKQENRRVRLAKGKNLIRSFREEWEARVLADADDGGREAEEAFEREIADQG